MTSQLVSLDSLANSQSYRAKASDEANLTKLMQSYQGDRLVKYLHLQTEVEMLLQQVQTQKQQKPKNAQSDRMN
jgi:hypothetical protein